MSTEFRISLLGKQDRNSFRCGVGPLDHYLQRQAGQDMRRKISMCYVAEVESTGEVVGFYTLSAAEIPIIDIPDDMARKLPHYRSVPAGRIGRLAVSESFRGQGLGGALVADAVTRMLNNDVAFFAAVVDAKDDQAEAFYRHLGFKNYGSLPGKMIATIKGLVG